MDYYGNNDWRDYHLAHYGRKGMKKGKHLPGTTWWKDLKDFTGISAMQEAQRQDAIQKRERQLGEAAFARTWQGYKENASDKDKMRAEGADLERWHDHRRKEDEAFSKEMAAEREYNNKNLSTRAVRAKHDAKNLVSRAKTAWKTDITGSAYKPMAAKAQRKADSLKDDSERIGKRLVANPFTGEKDYYSGHDKETRKERQKWIGEDTREARKYADQSRKYQKEADKWNAKYDRSLVGRAKKTAKKGRKRLRSLFDR